jgi:pilus assembly protein FimV
MSRGQNPLVLMMALSLPGAAQALGLGEIHVNSALNEPLAADIEIVGATAEELTSLTASVANRDTFLRFGVERPVFLASATFKVSHDANGRPVLVIRSTDSFTEPVVNLLVDLRWHSGEVIRQYSLLLDPAGFPAATQVAAAVRSAPAPLEPLALPVAAAAVAKTWLAAATPNAAKPTRATTHVKIGAKATLRGVAWRVGARSDSDLKKTMLAIFRANPNAFEGNINRLRLGAVLMIPPAADITAISKEDASREIHAQMAAWHAMPIPTTAATVASAAPAASDAPRAAIQADGDAPQTVALNLRVQSLEQGIHDIQNQLQRANERLLGVQAQVRYAEQTLQDPVTVAPSQGQWLLKSLFGGLVLVAGAFGAMFLVRRRATPQINTIPTMAGSVPMGGEASSHAAQQVLEAAPRETPRPQPQPTFQDSIESLAARVQDSNAAPPPKHVFTVNEDELRAAYEDTLDLSGETAILAAEMAVVSGDTANLAAATVKLNTHALQAGRVAAVDESATVDEVAMSDESATLMIDAEELHVDTTELDYNLVDLDLTAQHVHMPSVLHERAVFKERRTNLVDVLKKAVEREPERRDLRMKLLETYYAAAATNRQAFLEVAQKLARDPGRLGEGEWDKIALMGRQIAADTGLFSDSETEDDNKLADCA